ncbi:hypothetical protein T484DRAFT_1639413, partial [Baffinella frigidus]
GCSFQGVGCSFQGVGCSFQGVGCSFQGVGSEPGSLKRTARRSSVAPTSSCSAASAEDTLSGPARFTNVRFCTAIIHVEAI